MERGFKKLSGEADNEDNWPICGVQKEGENPSWSHENCCLQGNLAGESPCLAVYCYQLWIAANIIDCHTLAHFRWNRTPLGPILPGIKVYEHSSNQSRKGENIKYPPCPSLFTTAPFPAHNVQKNNNKNESKPCNLTCSDISDSYFQLLRNLPHLNNTLITFYYTRGFVCGLSFFVI